MRQIRFDSSDVFENLAVEEWLLSPQAPTPPLLFLWQTPAAVVLGKNQNPWLECRPARLEAERIALARRVSGGGAVYHDLGNLNFAFVWDRKNYRRETVEQIVVNAIRRLGISLERVGRSGLGIGGRKCSGQAFCYRGERVLHHGTLLVCADLERLHRALEPTAVDIEGRAVRSERSPVMNLTEHKPDLTVVDCKELIASEAPALEGVPPWEVIRSLAEQRRSWDWTYGSTPPFEAAIRGTPVRLRIEGGKVAEVMAADRREWEQLLGAPFRSPALAHRLPPDLAESVLALEL